MDGTMSQEEINALLNNPSGTDENPENTLTEQEKDAIGEISNISMGTAATTLFSLVNRKVEISTPVVAFANWSDICDAYEKPCVFIRIAYTVGLDGSNILVLKEHDVKVITDLMMGGDGTNTDGELGELHLSAISEAMNQMMGSAATSLSSMLDKVIDISPPSADLIDLQQTIDESQIDEFLAGEFVKISFRLEIGDLVDSEIMQLYPVSFAKEMCANVTSNMEEDSNSTAGMSEKENTQSTPAAQPTPAPQPQPQMAAQQPMMGQPMMGQPVPPMGGQRPPMGQPMMGQPMMGQMPRPQAPQMQNGNLMGQLGGARPIPHFVRKSTGEIINITKPEFIIGKSKTKADYAIENNSAISREHCIVIQRDGVNYIKDNNSTNHTYVNGVELQPGKEVLLKHKTEVRLGDEEFTFLLRKGE